MRGGDWPAIHESRLSAGGSPSRSFYYHEAHLIEILHCVGEVGVVLADPGILPDRLEVVAELNRGEGVGVSGASRDTLRHHYRVDTDGLVEWANLTIASGHNNLAMNQGVLEVARQFVHRPNIPEPMPNRVEAVWCFESYLLDPCNRRNAPQGRTCRRRRRSVRWGRSTRAPTFLSLATETPCRATMRPVARDRVACRRSARRGGAGTRVSSAHT